MKYSARTILTKISPTAYLSDLVSARHRIALVLLGLIASIAAAIYILFPASWRSMTLLINARQADQLDIAQCIDMNDKQNANLSIPKSTIRQSCINKLAFPLTSNAVSDAHLLRTATQSTGRSNDSLSRINAFLEKYGATYSFSAKNGSIDSIITGLDIWIVNKHGASRSFSEVISIRDLFVSPYQSVYISVPISESVSKLMLDEKSNPQYDWYINAVSGVHFRIQ